MVAFALLGFQLLEFPHFAASAQHDRGSHASFEYYFSRGFQFGVDVFQNVGPYGFVHHADSYSGYAHGTRVWLKTFLRLGLAALVLVAAVRFRPRWLGLVWWLSFFVLFPLGAPRDEEWIAANEVYAYLMVYLPGLFLLDGVRRGRQGWAIDGLLSAFLAFVALTKHTSLMLTLAVIGLAVAARLLAREVAAAGRLGLLFVVFIVVHWMGAGQRLLHLPHFLQGAFWFSEGYNEAMALAEPTSVTLMGAGIVLLLVTLSVADMVASGDRRLLALLNLAFVYLTWKHGFVRADAKHVAVLFYAAFFYALLFAFFRPVELRSGAPQPAWIHPVRAGGAALTAMLAFAGLQNAIAPTHYEPGRLLQHWRHNASWMFFPSAETSHVEADLARQREKSRLPRVRAAVGGASIDQFGYQPGYVLLNELNYRPRPMPISFAAANPPLLTRNEAFYRSPSAPEFVLVHIDGLEDRLTAQDDALALGALLENYAPLFREGEQLLLRRNPPRARRPRAEWTLLREVEAGLGETVGLEDLAPRFLWMTAEVETSLAGRLRSLFYKPPAARIVLEFQGGRSRSARLVTSMARTPFPIRPLIERNGDLLAAFRGRIRRDVKRLRITAADGHRDLFRDRVRLRFYAGPRPRTPTGISGSG